MSSYELVYQKLRENILNGHYKHGDELRETAVGKEIGVSRTPVREALRQLELEGLVTIIPNRGAFVNGISEQDVQDIYLIRARLEGLCARMAAERIDESTLEEMEETMMLTAFHEEQGHYDQLFKLDSRFHSLLYEACKSKILEHELKIFHQYVQQVRKNALKKEARVYSFSYLYSYLCETKGYSNEDNSRNHRNTERLQSPFRRKVWNRDIGAFRQRGSW